MQSPLPELADPVVAPQAAPEMLDDLVRCNIELSRALLRLMDASDKAKATEASAEAPEASVPPPVDTTGPGAAPTCCNPWGRLPPSFPFALAPPPVNVARFSVPVTCPVKAFPTKAAVAPPAPVRQAYPCPCAPCPSAPCPCAPCPSAPCPCAPCPCAPCPCAPCPCAPCAACPCASCPFLQRAAFDRERRREAEEEDDDGDASDGCAGWASMLEVIVNIVMILLLTLWISSWM